jgi:hypothetical protein
VTSLSGPIDWDRLVFSGGGIGGLNQPPAPDSTVIDEPTPTELLENRQLLEQGPTAPLPELPPEEPPPPGDTTAPDTTITAGPKAKTKSKSASFEFSSTEAGSSFECKLEPCTSPRDVKVKKGKHSFAVRATDAAGNVDPTPATQSWKVKKKKKK